ncbi:MAG: EpsI family protein, partial [Deltaproteobacteria bacterium RBG_16_42_7]
RSQKSEVSTELQDGRGKLEDGSTEDRDGRWKKGAGSGEASTTKPLNHSTTQPLYKSLVQPVFIVAVILLGLTLVLSKTIEFREKVPINKPFKEFPLQIGEWIGKRQEIEQKFLKELDLSDYIMVDYKNPQGKEVNFYVAYYESQRKGESIHSPETCLPAGGWIFNEAGSTTITLSKSSPVQTQVNRAFMEKAGMRELAYYWFPQRGRILTNITQLKIYTFWDALTKQRTDGALVRIITPVYKSETLQDAEARLQGFVREIVPVLDEYIPGK